MADTFDTTSHHSHAAIRKNLMIELYTLIMLTIVNFVYHSVIYLDNIDINLLRMSIVV